LRKSDPCGKKCTLRPDDLRIRWQYRDCVNALRSSCRRFVRVREESIIDANNLGTFYRHVNQQLTHRDNIGALVDSTEELITYNCQKANLLNTYFGSVCTADNGTYPGVYLLSYCSAYLPAIFIFCCLFSFAAYFLCVLFICLYMYVCYFFSTIYDE